MKRSIVAVVNSAQARLLILEPEDSPVARVSSRLTEQITLDNPVAVTAGEELWANTKTGLNRGSGSAHSYDDHRDKHLVEFERRFSQQITAKILALLQSEQINRLLIIAEPQILGTLRKSLTESLPATVRVEDLAKNLGYLSPHELHGYLLDQGLAV